MKIETLLRRCSGFSDISDLDQTKQKTELSLDCSSSRALTFPKQVGVVFSISCFWERRLTKFPLIPKSSLPFGSIEDK